MVDVKDSGSSSYHSTPVGLFVCVDVKSSHKL